MIRIPNAKRFFHSLFYPLLLSSVFSNAQAQSWEVKQTLSPTPVTADMQYGKSISIDQNLMAVGAWRDPLGTDSSDLFRAGAVYLYVKGNENWNFHQKLTAPVRQSNMLFGTRVQLLDSSLFVSAFNEANGHGLGKIYVYKWNSDGTIEHQQTIEAPDTTIYFGWSFKAYKDNLIIGANADYKGLTDTGNMPIAGAVYSYALKNDSWEFNQKILAFNPESNAQFGVSVDLNDTILIVGAAFWSKGMGNVNVYRKDSNQNWQIFQVLGKRLGKQDDFFGNDVLIQGDKIIIGVQGEDYADPRVFTNAGAVYIYERPTRFYEQSALVRSPDPHDHAFFGSSLSQYGTQLLVGSQGNQTDLAGANILAKAGAVYLVGDTSGSLNKMQKIVAPKRRKNAAFGIHVAADDQNIVVAATEDYDHMDTLGVGKVYVFSPKTTSNFSMKSEQQIKVYPNPNQGKFTIVGNDYEERTVEIYDPHGRLLFTANLGSKNSTITHKLSTGIYYLVVEGEGSRRSAKFVVVD